MRHPVYRIFLPEQIEGSKYTISMQGTINTQKEEKWIEEATLVFRAF